MCLIFSVWLEYAHEDSKDASIGSNTHSLQLPLWQSTRCTRAREFPQSAAQWLGQPKRPKQEAQGLYVSHTSQCNLRSHETGKRKIRGSEAEVRLLRNSEHCRVGEFEVSWHLSKITQKKLPLGLNYHGPYLNIGDQLHISCGFRKFLKWLQE